MIINIILRKNVLKNILNLLKKNLLVIRKIEEYNSNKWIVLMKSIKIMSNQEKIIKIILIKIMVKLILNINVLKMIIN